MKRIKIALFIRGFHNGGIEKVFELYYSHMDLSYFDIHIITHMENFPDKRIFFEKLGCIVHEFSKLHGHKITMKNLKEYSQLFKKYRFDIVHNNMPENLLPMLYAKHYKVPCRIIHAHSVYNKNFSYMNKFKMKIYKLGFELNARLASKLVGVSKEAAESAFCSYANRAIFLPNAREVDKFRFNSFVREEMRKKLSINNFFVIGHIGRYENDMKNQDFIIEVFANLVKKNNSILLFLIGDGSLKKSYMDKVISRGLEHKVVFAGNVNNIEEYLMAMDLFVFPSKQEGLGIAAVEAQTTGLHCLISDQVPSEVKVTENVIFLPIYGENAVQIWVDAINMFLKGEVGDRYSAADDVIRAGYDIFNQVHVLESIYLS